MTKEEAKQIVAEMGLSEEAVVRIEQLLAGYGDKDQIATETIDKILAIVDIEMDATKLEADVYKKGINMADQFLDKVDGESGKIADEIDKGQDSGML